MPYEARVTQTHTSNGSVANSSNVTITFQIRRTDYAMIGYNHEGSAYWRINCDGQSTGNKYFTFDWNYHPQNQWWTVGSHTFTVSHNADGSKNIGFDGYYHTGISPSDLGASATATLTKIPRYAKITSFKNISSTITSATFSWTADAECDWLEYSLNNGSWVSSGGSNFTVSNLTPETTYSLKIRIRRKDSGLYTESDNISFSTKPLARITNTPLEMQIGGSLTLRFENYQNNAVYLRFEMREPGGRWEQVTTVHNIQTSSYTWNLSNYASRMYQLCQNSDYIEISVVYGTIINGKDYYKGAYGKAFVPSSGSKPTFSNFTFMNTDLTTSNIVGNTQNMVCLFGNLRVSIPAADRAIANNGATMSHYNIAISSGNTVVSKTVSYSFSDINVNFGSFQTAGSYTIRVDAVDSRGYSSGIISKNFTVYPYHTPSITANVERLNGFEAETTLSLTALLSQINIAGSIKNSLQKIEYRYAESGFGFPSLYTQISDFSTSQDGNDIVITVNKPNFLTLDINKTYIFEFKVTDRISSYTITPPVNQGVSVVNILDNGNVLVGVPPTQENVTDKKANLIISKDIKAKNRYLVEELDTKSSLYASMGGTAITKNADLNDFKEVGSYFCDLTVTAGTIKNCPINSAFTMEIKKGNGTSYPKQIISDFSSSRKFERTYFHDSNTWGDWDLSWHSNGTITDINNAVKSLYLLMHPVGSIVMTTENSNPGNTFGGTWQSWGAGRVPVGVDSSQVDFNTAEKTGGTNTSSHFHRPGSLAANIGAVDNDTTSIGYDAVDKTGATYDYAFSHGNLKTNIPASRVNHATSIWGKTADTEISNLQPYITCYMWKRTA